MTGVRNLIILMLIKIICNWQQPNLGFIKYDVHATCLVYYFFFLDRQFRGDVAILVFLKTMASYNPTSLTPSLFTEVPVLSQESERSECICVLGICLFLRFFYCIFGTFPTVWYFFSFYYSHGELKLKQKSTILKNLRVSTYL